MMKVPWWTRAAAVLGAMALPAPLSAQLPGPREASAPSAPASDGQPVSCQACAWGDGEDCARLTIVLLDPHQHLFQGHLSGTADRRTRRFGFDVSGSYDEGRIKFQNRAGGEYYLAVWPDRLKGRFMSSYNAKSSRWDIEFICDGPTSRVVRTAG